jgi:hypothetical protein
MVALALAPAVAPPALRARRAAPPAALSRAAPALPPPRALPRALPQRASLRRALAPPRPTRPRLFSTTASASAASASPPAPDWASAARAHLSLALDARARVALPQGDRPAEGVAPFSHLLWAFLGCFASMALLGIADVALAQRGVPFMMGSFGTISVLYFGVGLRAPVLRLWNVVVGHACAAAFACLAVAYVGALGAVCAGLCARRRRRSR